MRSIVIVRTGGEIGIKSKPVRSIYEKILLRTIRQSLKEARIPFSSITRIAGRIYINTEEGERAVLVAAKTFGVSSASAGVAVKSDLETIVKVGTEVAEKSSLLGHLLWIAGELEPTSTRAPRSRRSWVSLYLGSARVLRWI